MAKSYASMPTKAQWLSDSSVTLATRAKDPVLSRIDELVELYNSNPPLRFATMPDLYFSIDYWLKIAPDNKTMEKGRTPAMTALYKVVVDALCGLFNCTINALPRELELMFGREMTNHGVAIDLKLGMAQYMSSAEAQRYKLRFKNGKAYQLNWFEPNAEPKLVLANSSHGYSVIRRGGMEQLADFSGFVMSMSRSFYMAKHVVGTRNSHDGTFHSSYLGDQAISAAGTIFIKDGVVGGLRPDSGHFKPGDVNMLAVLQAFRMLGVSLSTIAVFTHDGKSFATAEDFLKSNTVREAFRNAREQTLASNKAGFASRDQPDMTKFPTAADRRAGWVSPPPKLPSGVNPAAFKRINI